MVDTAKAMGFPFMAGSSLPVTWRLPAVDLPLGSEIDEAALRGLRRNRQLRLSWLESLQCLVERRKGGETGSSAVTAALGGGSGRRCGGLVGAGGCDPQLFEACLCRSFRLSSPRPGFGHVYPDSADARPRTTRSCSGSNTPTVSRARCSCSRARSGFYCRIRIKGQSEPASTLMYLAGIQPNQTLPNFFSPLAHHIETVFKTGRPPYPIETDFAHDRPGRRPSTCTRARNASKRPTCSGQLPPAESTFWRS